MLIKNSNTDIVIMLKYQDHHDKLKIYYTNIFLAFKLILIMLKKITFLSKKYHIS